MPESFDGQFGLLTDGLQAKLDRILEDGSDLDINIDVVDMLSKAVMTDVRQTLWKTQSQMILDRRATRIAKSWRQQSQHPALTHEVFESYLELQLELLLIYNCIRDDDASRRDIERSRAVKYLRFLAAAEAMQSHSHETAISPILAKLLAGITLKEYVEFAAYLNHISRIRDATESNGNTLCQPQDVATIDYCTAEAELANSLCSCTNVGHQRLLELRVHILDFVFGQAAAISQHHPGISEFNNQESALKESFNSAFRKWILSSDAPLIPTNAKIVFGAFYDCDDSVTLLEFQTKCWFASEYKEEHEIVRKRYGLARPLSKSDLSGPVLTEDDVG
jgi:hypothetical protein